MFKKLNRYVSCVLLCTSVLRGVSPLLASGNSSRPWWEMLDEGGAAASVPPMIEPIASTQEPGTSVLNNPDSAQQRLKRSLL